jgi:hypothetical protein
MVEMGISTLRPFLHFTKSSPKTAHTIDNSCLVLPV